MKLFAKLFLGTGIPFGLIMGLWAGLDSGVEAGIAVGLGSGVFFGLGMAVVLGMLHVVITKRAGGLPTDGVRSVRELELALPVNEAFAKCVQAVERAGGRIHSRDAAAGLIEARTRVSWKSWGENIRVELSQVGAASTRVKVSSSPRLKTTLADYGKGFQNVESISKLLTA